MVITNKKKARFFNRLFFLTSLVMAIAMLILFLKDYSLYAIMIGAAFIVWFFIFQLFDFQHVEFAVDEKVILRYYPAVKFGLKDYSSIEFSIKMLYDVRFETSMFGLVTDLFLVVKTKRGIAEYPSVSLAAMTKDDIKKIKQILNEILEK